VQEAGLVGPVGDHLRLEQPRTERGQQPALRADEPAGERCDRHADLPGLIEVRLPANVARQAVGLGGGPVGVETLAASLSEERDTIEDVYEPYLMQIGFLQRSPRGRIATRAAWENLSLRPPPPRSDAGQRTVL